MSLTNSHARSWFSAVLKIDRCEPPSTDGAMPPSLPGIGDRADLALEVGVLLDDRRRRPRAHESIIATLPCAKLSRSVGLLPRGAAGRREAVLGGEAGVEARCPPATRRCRGPRSTRRRPARRPRRRRPRRTGRRRTRRRPATANGIMSGCAALMASPAATISSQVVGGCEPGLLEDVGAVDERPHAGVPRHAVELVVVGAGLDEARDEVVAQTRVVDVVGRGRASAPASANSAVQVVPISATSGVVPPAIEVTNLSWASAHGTNCDVELGAGLFREGVADLVEERLGVGVGAFHDPDGERLALASTPRPLGTAAVECGPAPAGAEQRRSAAAPDQTRVLGAATDRSRDRGLPVELERWSPLRRQDRAGQS